MKVVYMDTWYFDRVTSGIPMYFKGYYYRWHSIDGVEFIERAKKDSKRIKKPNGCRAGEHWEYVSWERVELRRAYS